MSNVVTRTHDGIDYTTVDEVKAHLRVLDTNEDAYIEGLIEAAFDIAENYVGYSIRKSSVEHWFECPVDGKFTIYSRILSVTSLQYVNDAGTLTSLAYNTTGQTYGNYGFAIEPTADAASLYDYGMKYKAVVVEGFELPSASVNDGFKFPKAIKSAIFMICANLYDNRMDDVIGAAISPIPMNSKYLLDPYKMHVFV